MDPKILQFLEILTYSSPILLFSGIVLSFIFYRRLNSVHHLLLWYLVIAFVIDITGRILAIYFNNNLILIPIFGLLELIVLTTLYFRHFLDVKNRLWLTPIILLILFNLFEISSLFGVVPKDFHSHSRVLDSLAIVTMSIVFFIKQIGKEEPAPSSIMVLNMIIFTFQSINLILYLPLNFLINEKTNVKFYFWAASLAITLIFYLSIIRIIWIHGKNLKR